MIAQFDGVSKVYSKQDGLRPSSFKLNEGEIIGLFGLNGSGKTTTLKLLSGLLKPDSGRIEINQLTPRDSRDQISYLGDKESFYSWMTPLKLKDFMSGLFNNFNEQRFDELMEKLEVPQKRFEQMSKGQKQRLRLVATMARDAKLYLLDEPLSGIDLVSRELIIKTLISNWQEGACMLLSTHEIKEVENLFDRGIYLKDGEIISDVKSEDLRQNDSSLSAHFIQLHQGGVQA